MRHLSDKETNPHLARTDPVLNYHRIGRHSLFPLYHQTIFVEILFLIIKNTFLAWQETTHLFHFFILDNF